MCEVTAPPCPPLLTVSAPFRRKNAFSNTFSRFSRCSFSLGNAGLSSTGSADRKGVRETGRARERAGERERERVGCATSKQNCGGANKRQSKVRGGCIRFNKLNPGPVVAPTQRVLLSVWACNSLRAHKHKRLGLARDPKTQPAPTCCPGSRNGNNTNRSRSCCPRTWLQLRAAGGRSWSRSRGGVAASSCVQQVGRLSEREAERLIALQQHPVCISVHICFSNNC